MSLKPNSNILTFTFNDKEIKIIGVNHIERGISIKEIENIVNYATSKRNVIYLLELDEKLNKHQLRLNKKGDFTTKLIMEKFKKIYKEMFNTINFKGWDIRQQLLTQPYQNSLYHNPGDLTMKQAFENFIDKIPKNKQISIGNKKNYDKKIYDYINGEYKQKYNTQNNFINGGMFDWIIIEHINKKNYKKQWDQLKLNEIKGINTEMRGFIEHLRRIFMRISDLNILEKILQNNNKNYIIFVGQHHFDNLKMHLKNLAII